MSDPAFEALIAANPIADDQPVTTPEFELPMPRRGRAFSVIVMSSAILVGGWLGWGVVAVRQSGGADTNGCVVVAETVIARSSVCLTSP